MLFRFYSMRLLYENLKRFTFVLFKIPIMKNMMLTESKDDKKGGPYAEQINEFRKMPFQFSCLGISCLGWSIILIILLVVYWVYKK